MEAGADVNARDYFGKTSLIMAAGRAKAQPSWRSCCPGGAQIDAVDNDGDPAIAWAASREDGLPLVLFLLDHGAGLAVANKAGARCS